MLTSEQDEDLPIPTREEIDAMAAPALRLALQLSFKVIEVQQEHIRVLREKLSLANSK